MSRPPPPPLETPRLVLVAATPDLVRAELAGRETFAPLLAARVPTTWPPPFNDEGTMTWILNMLVDDADAVGWVAWYLLLLGPDGSRTAIGTGGFKGRPDEEGTVEIGYSILEEHQRRGYAPEAVAALVQWAFSHVEVTRIIAHTIPDGRASQRVLEKNGFRFVGEGLEEGAVMYERRRV